jgi:hypothetical protein
MRPTPCVDGIEIQSEEESLAFIAA